MKNLILWGAVCIFTAHFNQLFSQNVEIQNCSLRKKNAAAIDGIAKPYTQKLILGNEHIEERDVMFEKKIWRELELTEKMNHHFINVKGTLLDKLKDAYDKGQIEFYDPVDDNFSCTLNEESVKKIFGKYDTISMFDPDKEILESKIVYNPLDQNNLIRYRIKEVWYFDSKQSKMKVRILGFAPVMRYYDENDNFVAEAPMFWIYYPHARETLAQYYLGDNFSEAKNLTWDDIFQLRYFSSHITKENNLYDRRISDYKSGYDAISEAENIHNSIFNFEQDLWEK
jgi:gliding motility associated protien GldN